MQFQTYYKQSSQEVVR